MVAVADKAVAAGSGGRLRRDPRFIIPAGFLLLLAAGSLLIGLTPLDPYSCSLSDALLRPSREHLFGTSLHGCDYLAQILYGARASLLIAAVVVGVAAVVGIIVGAVAGYFGGWVDVVLSRLTDAWLSLPLILGGIMILALLDHRSVLTVSLVLAAFGWPGMARMVRSSVLQVAGRQYVDAAVALGAGHARILLRHILPNALRPLLVFASAYAGTVIAVEATLSYMGVGLQLPTVSWGIMLFVAQERVSDAPHLLLFPAAFLCVTVCCFVLLAEVIRDSVDPRRQ